MAKNKENGEMIKGNDCKFIGLIIRIAMKYEKYQLKWSNEDFRVTILSKAKKLLVIDFPPFRANDKEEMILYPNEIFKLTTYPGNETIINRASYLWKKGIDEFNHFKINIRCKC